jgi:hypothetical protein
MSDHLGSTLEEGYTTLKSLQERVASSPLDPTQRAKWVTAVAQKLTARGLLLTEQQYADVTSERALQVGDHVHFLRNGAQGFVRAVNTDGSVDVFSGNMRHRNIRWTALERQPQ